MNPRHAIRLLTVVTLALPSSRAFAQASGGIDTVTVTSAAPGTVARLTVRIAGRGVKVIPASLTSWSSDSGYVLSTPFRIVVPEGRFSVAVSPASPDTTAVAAAFRYRTPAGERYESTMAAPFTVERADSAGVVSTTSTKMRTERLP